MLSQPLVEEKKMDGDKLERIMAYARAGYVVPIAIEYESVGAEERAEIAPHLIAAIKASAERGQVNNLAELFGMPAVNADFNRILTQHLFVGIAYCIRNNMRTQLQGLLEGDYYGLPEIARSAAQAALDNLQSRKSEKIRRALEEPGQLVPPTRSRTSDARTLRR
jgi:hypothetical protein